MTKSTCYEQIDSKSEQRTLRVLFPKPPEEEILVGPVTKPISEAERKVTVLRTRVRSDSGQFSDHGLRVCSSMGNHALEGWDLMEDTGALVGALDEILDDSTGLTIIVERGILENPLPLPQPQMV